MSLVNTDWLEGNLEKVKIIDCSWHMPIVKRNSYKEVCTDKTNHAEVVKLEFDPKIISYEEILNFFFEIHNSTTLNSQGPDFGTQYRSEIFYLNDNQKKIANKIIEKENQRLSGKVVTKLSILKNYCPAEEYHQKYLEKR